MSRTKRIVKGFAYGLGSQFLMLFVGLFLTPILLRWIGDQPYSQWLMVSQGLTLLALLDFGFTSLIPREIANASGDKSNPSKRVRQVVNEIALILLAILPISILVVTLLSLGYVHFNPDSQSAVWMISVTFLLSIPLRIPAAVLNGLQDLEFLSVIQIIAWALSITCNVVLAYVGFGIYALILGWISSILFSAICTITRLYLLHPEIFRISVETSVRESISVWVRPCLWSTTRQLSTLLTGGCDLLILGWKLGPEAVLIYGFTSKLVSIGAQCPYQIATLAQPAITQIKKLYDVDRLFRASWAINLVVLLISGLIAVIIMGFNSLFLQLWVGSQRDGGPLLTLLCVILMLVRHIGFTWTSFLFNLGDDKFVSIISIADGILTTLLSILLVPQLGILGLPFASILSATSTQLIFSIRRVASELSLSIRDIWTILFPWIVSIVLCLVISMIGHFAIDNEYHLIGWIFILTAILIYLLATYRQTKREPLYSYVHLFRSKSRIR
jgi:O-antigen/teichoic acid export membrane protein